MAQVILKDVAKKFDEVIAVKDFNLDVEDKEFVILVGPSGCGKSTTLRIIAGLEEADTGEIVIGDRVVNDVPPKDRNIAMVFQNYALYPHMNVYDNMAFGLKLRKTPRPEIERRVREAARVLGIEDLLKRKPKQLSGGQRQRVALGRAIVRNPLVFLMDEPLSNLDAKLRVQMRVEIEKLHKRLSTTFIYVTHDQTEAMTMGDRIVIMKDGLTQQVGSPQEVYENPQNMFVAGFIGSPSMNFIKAKITEDHHLRASNLDIPASAMVREVIDRKNLRNREIILGIRPEHLEDAAFVPEERRFGLIDTVVDVIEPMGNEIYLYADIGGVQSMARINPESRVRGEDRITLALETERIHLFDPETEVAYI
ncbi:multiple sugar transport system ATP-binding protein [Candidatus Hakubella thermalkaliphila]|uniref:Multiple sugar transport system ATP-binding protein n=1 Tax=Candidatus Hakubella thermalkaliphila TaxID=2754717 RepID=A0A6V8PB04_9ACTN|nr:sn-glycerol-3-phosphate ABC transporter ATP-binding protein UgpC [Candidatus Hakubella thermalkaliphila]MBT9170559.1 Trehalose import ATP-binding protein SugC [Actinomycetota bacterium]GFP18861.1 multiple sugar transport system ATP-binding protein [Candidatus Hakubella thermalkaliphila]GFP23213.1 multiple sugar transport system ATP-binding protein [Candidatus Hakubella thermalkaliphila]GFP29842.1 multiple sugar transport system ATP-binding protein [Candidatus Hakubella thermalkaliphila]GFP3